MANVLPPKKPAHVKDYEAVEDDEQKESDPSEVPALRRRK